MARPFFLYEDPYIIAKNKTVIEAIYKSREDKIARGFSVRVPEHGCEIG